MTTKKLLSALATATLAAGMVALSANAASADETDSWLGPGSWYGPSDSGTDSWGGPTGGGDDGTDSWGGPTGGGDDGTDSWGGPTGGGDS